MNVFIKTLVIQYSKILVIGPHYVKYEEGGQGEADSTPLHETVVFLDRQVVCCFEEEGCEEGYWSVPVHK